MSAGEICILAGGLSSRMGKDKAWLRLGGKTLLGRVRAAAAQTSWPVRIIRRDAVPRCGPLGGVYTAMGTTSADWALFLACDMPFVTPELLEKLIDSLAPKRRAVFSRHGREGRAGFPFVLRRELLTVVERQLAENRYSLQALAAACQARMLVLPAGHRALFNVNTPEDWKTARGWV